VAREPAAHRLPDHARAETARTLAATPGVAGEPTDAERGRTLLTATRTGALCTVAVDPAGFPFGSLIAYAVDDVGRPLLCLSDLAEHSRNLSSAAARSAPPTRPAIDAEPRERGRGPHP
jgi:hypothetical protein